MTGFDENGPYPGVLQDIRHSAVSRFDDYKPIDLQMGHPLQGRPLVRRVESVEASEGWCCF